MRMFAAMPDLELKPTEWRLKGFKRPKRRMSDRALKWWMTGLGIWAATALYFYRSVFPGAATWPMWMLGLGPGLYLWFYLVFTSKD